MLQQFTVRDDAGNLVMIVRGAAAACAPATAGGGGGGGGDADQAITATVRIPALGYVGHTDPRTWLVTSLYRRLTGQIPASFSTGGPHRLRRQVTGGATPDDPEQTVIGTVVGEANDGRSIDLWLSHGPTAQPSRVAVETTQTGADDVVTLIHTGWTNTNRHERPRFTDWQDDLGRWASEGS